MYFENRFPESGSGQILHPVRAGQNILDLIRRPRIATILLCVDHAAAVTVQTSNHDTLSRKLRESEKGSDGLYRFEYESYTQDGSGGMHGNITSITLDCDAQFYIMYGITRRICFPHQFSHAGTDRLGSRILLHAARSV